MQGGLLRATGHSSGHPKYTITEQSIQSIGLNGQPGHATIVRDRLFHSICPSTYLSTISIYPSHYPPSPSSSPSLSPSPTPYGGWKSILIDESTRNILRGLQRNDSFQHLRDA